MNKVVDYAERLFLVLLSATFLHAILIRVTEHPYVLLLAISETLPVILIIIRRPGEMLMKPYPFILALLGTSAPLLVRPSPGGFTLIPETLVIFLLSEQGYDAECEVLQEVKGLGGTTLAVTNRVDQRARAASDLLIEFDFELPELVRLGPHIFAGQLTGLYTGLKKGLDPDHPRHLSRVVVLDEEAAAD